MSTATVPPEVAEYLDAVRAALADLPAAEQDDLLGEVEASLIEASAESEGPLAARLGPADQFAAELRAAAGLHAPPEPQARPSSSLPRALREAARSPQVRALGRVASELAPIWWVVRAYVAVGAIALLAHASWSSAEALVPRFGTGSRGLLAILLAVAVSVAVGLRVRRHPLPLPWLATVANVALLVVAVPVASRIADHRAPTGPVFVVAAPPLPGLVSGGVPIENIYPYSRDGRLLHDVLLYDGAGRPIEIGAGALDPDRRVLHVLGGRGLIFNSFPIRYYEPGTRRVARPNAGPRVRVPRVLTPPLAPRAR